MVGPGTRSVAFVLSTWPLGIFLGWICVAIDHIVGFQELLPSPDNLSGLAFILVGSLLRYWAGSVFYMHNPSMVSFKPPSNLITTGPWKYSRNPLYMGLIVMGAGFSLLFSSYTDLLLTAVGATLLQIEVAFHEERILAERFRDSYRDYKARVRRWI